MTENLGEQTSVIDYILVDKRLEKNVEEIIVDEIGTHKLKGNNESDHNTILMTINIKTTKDPKKLKRWKKGNPQQWKKYNEILSKLNEKHANPDYTTLEKYINMALEESRKSYHKYKQQTK